MKDGNPLRDCALSVATLGVVIALALPWVGGCHRSGEQAGRTAILEFEALDEGLAPTLEAAAVTGVERLGGFFGAPFDAPVTLHIADSRAAFDEYAQTKWGFPKTQCWMVGAAENPGLLLLSPRVWVKEACEHNPEDPQHVRDIIIHELVHTYHMRRNPSDEFDGVTDIDWFVEGIAVYASGQLERSHRGKAAQAVRNGAAPRDLADAWKGPHRYGISGSMAAFIDDRWGRGTLTELLTATDQPSLMGVLGTSEEEFLTLWRNWVLSRKTD